MNKKTYRLNNCSTLGPAFPDVESLRWQNEEDEWREFEEQKKDYSGLRIGKLQIQEGDEGGGDDDGEEEQVLEENEAGVMVLRSRKMQSGPWKMQQQQLQQQLQQQQQQPPPEERPPPPPENLDTPDKRSDGPSSYVPPALRGGQNRDRDRDYGPTIGGPRASRMKIAPDISNEESFPTLSASKNMDANSPWGRRRRDEGTFEEVRKGGSMSSRYDAGRLATGGPKLSLGNKFGALQDQS
ncbi:Protein CDV3 homolog [Gryllus bimaculatus]|nr:Protein CDV3 homolog [Gryllus bimaculatus]